MMDWPAVNIALPFGPIFVTVQYCSRVFAKFRLQLVVQRTSNLRCGKIILLCITLIASTLRYLVDFVVVAIGVLLPNRLTLPFYNKINWWWLPSCIKINF